MLPARRKSKAMKRAHRSHQALHPVGRSVCPRCGAAKLPHRACEKCGYVSPKVAIKVKTEET